MCHYVVIVQIKPLRVYVYHIDTNMYVLAVYVCTYTLQVLSPHSLNSVASKYCHMYGQYK